MNGACLDEYLATLEAKPEYPTDELLVRLVRIQQLAQSISVTLATGNAGSLQQLPLLMVVQSFQQRLDAFKSTLSPVLQANSRYPITGEN